MQSRAGRQYRPEDAADYWLRIFLPPPPEDCDCCWFCITSAAGPLTTWEMAPEALAGCELIVVLVLVR